MAFDHAWLNWLLFLEPAHDRYTHPCLQVLQNLYKMIMPNVKRIGKPAALLSAVFAIIYSVFQLLAAFKIIEHPHELFWLFLPSLILAFTFLITVICLHFLVNEENKIFAAIASAFAILYCAFGTIVYFTQLAVVIPP